MATVKRLINRFGKITGWNDVTATIFGRSLEGIMSIEYGDTTDWTNEYGAGGRPVGESDSNTEPTCMIELYLEEMRAIQESLPPGVVLQRIPPFSIIVEYDYQGKIYKDIIKNCRFRTNGVNTAQNQKKHTHRHEIKCSHIAWNGVDPLE